jgi:cyanophycinase
VDPEGCWRVLGESVVVVYDARRAGITAVDHDPLGAAQIQMHILPSGSWFDPWTGAARLPAALLH